VTDAVNIYCGWDGYYHLPLVVDYVDREIIGWRISRGRRVYLN